MVDKVTPQDVARKAKRVFPLMGRLMEAQMKSPAVPLPPVHFHVLNHVDSKPYTLSELAERMSITSASLSRTITVLEERGWVSRTRSEEDRRVIYIETTADGNGILREIEQRSEDFLANTLEHLAQDDLEKLMTGLDILIGTFAEAMSHLPSDSDK